MTESQNRSDPSLDYYAGGPPLHHVVLDALRNAGREIEPLDPDDLAGLDEFHGLGRAATLAQAQLSEIAEGERVLDVGAGIGGPARTLAYYAKARVTALEPTKRFCELNQELTRRTGLDGRVEVVRGDARQMPVDDEQFDVVWTQAVWPNIEDKTAMVSEMHRVLKQGGRLVLYEVVRGAAGGDLHYPLPWADEPAQSHLLSADELRMLVEAVGFSIKEWVEPPELFGRIGAVAESGGPGVTSGVEGVTLGLVMPDFKERMASLARNVEEQRISMVMSVCSKA
jgi:ubiquinone/menaquinone biosynthesis C-methylase UbiE